MLRIWAGKLGSDTKYNFILSVLSHRERGGEREREKKKKKQKKKSNTGTQNITAGNGHTSVPYND